MTLPSVKWGDAKRFFNNKIEYEISYEGGDAFILKKPSGSEKRGKLVVRIGHKFLKHTKELSPAILKKIERTFGISRHDILNY